jgi:hypothetical protein
MIIGRILEVDLAADLNVFFTGLTINVKTTLHGL